MFEVLNAKNVPLIRHKANIFNLDNYARISIEQDCLVLFETGVDYDNKAPNMIQFDSETEAQLAFDKIMGGKTASPTSRELKNNKTVHHAIQEEQTNWLE